MTLKMPELAQIEQSSTIKNEASLSCFLSVHCIKQIDSTIAVGLFSNRS